MRPDVPVRPPVPGSTVRLHLRGWSHMVITGRVRAIGGKRWDVGGQLVRPGAVLGWAYVRRTVRVSA